MTVVARPVLHRLIFIEHLKIISTEGIVSIYVVRGTFETSTTVEGLPKVS